MEQINKIILVLIIILYVIDIMCINHLFYKYKQNSVVLPNIIDYIVYPNMTNQNDSFNIL